VTLCLKPEVEGNTILRNVGTFSRNNTASHPHDLKI